MNSLKNPAALFSFDGKYILSNEPFKKITGLNEKQLRNKNIGSIFKEIFIDKILRTLEEKKFSFHSIQINNINYSLFIFPVIENLKDRLLVFLLGEDLEYEKEELLEVLIQKTPAGTFIYKDTFIFSNRTFQEITGYTEEELKKIRPYEIVHERYRKEVIEIIKKRLSGEKLEKHYDLLTIISKTGKEKHLELVTATIKYQGSYAGIGVCVDRTEKVELEQRLNYLYTHDEITNLPNRKKFIEYLSKSLNYAVKNSHLVAVILIDIKDMKLINKEYGYSVGDQLLKEIGKKLKKVVTNVDYVARVGDDEFGVIIYAFKSMGNLSENIEKILKEVEDTYLIDGFKIPVEVKMGISIFPKDGKTSEELYKNSEIALLKAKKTIGKKFEFFSEDSYKEISKILFLKGKIRDVIQKNSIKMFYQPIVQLQNNSIFGLESLFRLITSNGKIIMPQEIIPVAEETGLIVELGQKILDSVLDFSKKLPEKIKLSVNISPVQFNKTGFDDELIKNIKDRDINPEKLILEITESAIMSNISDKIRRIKKLKDFGIQIALDDFGTGYSSLNYLKRFPIDYLKIDISFVSGIGKDKSDEMIVKTIISMAKNLNMMTIAEGIENEQQLRFLRYEGCDFGQGYYFGKPASHNEILKLTDKNSL
ncbi:PAS domain S-box-containing protein/diguanylate cyclase (GGDEF) domain-containing protein [Persephonella hydrogeniphila]|uniref:PAS domain S-box-containing protein/diguanylate cyclase (GGDEF) domain-containing protein n=2 Tax=Persephonella hydrogeniphila TaxID=198703 RepID=A0A285MYQ5_9AQUI|nr:PAS domain S-box-containing protein/diguanylate cyclase (GGDEF) domain-containing protein [Persephonella hydrogeniphila]